MSRVIFALLAIGLTACGHAQPNPPGRKVERPGNVNLPRGEYVVTIEKQCFDGESLLGVVLVGARGGYVEFDPGLLEEIHFKVSRITTCDGKDLPFRHRDWHYPGGRIETCEKLVEGYLFGRTFNFRPFRGDGAQECVVATFLFSPGCGGKGTEVSVRISRAETCEQADSKAERPRAAMTGMPVKLSQEAEDRSGAGVL